MLQRAGAQEWVWLELKETSDMSFRFINKTEPSSYATGLANSMHVYSVPHTVCGSHLQFQCNLPEAMEYLSYMTPANSIISVSHKGFTGKTELKERWYGTEHNKRDYTAAQLALWDSSLKPGSEWDAMLSLPLPNPFIPTDFDLKAQPPTVAVYPALVEKKVVTALPLECMEEVDRPAKVAAVVASVAAAEVGAVLPPTAPTAEEEEQAEKKAEQSEAVAENDGEKKEQEEDGEEEDEEESGAEGSAATPAELPVLEGEHLLVWHMQDKVWAVPKLNVKIVLESAHACCTPLAVSLTELFAMCLKESLNEYSYYADCAGGKVHNICCVVEKFVALLCIELFRFSLNRYLP